MIKIATLVGCAIGDALGNPFEMKLANYEPLQEWEGEFREGGTFWWGQPGQYTDDTLMSVALGTSLVEHNGFNAQDIAEKYLAWKESGNTRGIGGTTAAAIHRFKMGASFEESGLTHNPDGTPVGGNGTAMRASPLGLAYRYDLMHLMEYAIKDAAITHNSQEPKVGSVAVALATALLANRTATPETVLQEVSNVLTSSLVKDKILLAQECIDKNIPQMEALAMIGSAGYVPETVGAAFYCLGATDNFKDAVILAVKAGGDTDTTAAVVGAFAGTWYGLEGIPQEYKDGVENFELLQELTDELLILKI